MMENDFILAVNVRSTAQFIDSQASLVSYKQASVFTE